MLSVVIAALVVSSAGYTFQESLLMGTMFLPGALGAKYLLPKVSFKKRSEGILAHYGKEQTKRNFGPGVTYSGSAYLHI